MPGLMSRILSRRADGASRVGGSGSSAAPADQPTVVVPAQTAGEEVAPEEVATTADPAAADGVTGVEGPGVEAAAPPESEQPTEVIAAVEAVESAEAGAAEPPATDATVVAAPAGATAEAPAVEPPPGDPAAELAAVEADPSLPAGAVPAPPEAPSFRNRGRLRRRLRYLRRVRELALRDLGGLVFDLDRFGRERPDLVRLKLDGLASIDGELRALEVALDDVHDVEELQEPGISACAKCGSLHGSEARFCPACGTPVGEAAADPEPQPEAAEPAPDQPQQ
jgi:hypothetical protein